MKKLSYKEGTWFAVPLRQGGYAVGLAARVTPKENLLLAYFFGPKRENIPLLEELTPFTRDQAILVLMTGDLHLINGQWQIIGQATDWNRSEWPIPKFVRHEEFTNRIYLLEYSDDDPSTFIRQTKITEEESKNLQEDTSSGSGAAEIKLTKLLD